MTERGSLHWIGSSGKMGVFSWFASVLGAVFCALIFAQIIDCIKHRQVTDLDVTESRFSRPRIPFCATGALWGRVTPFCRPLF